jgi:toxin HigB-1
MIRNYKDRNTAAVAEGRAAKGFPAELVRVAQHKLKMLADAAALHDLRSPPGNRLEALKGDRKGEYSIRINDQWRVCFKWTVAGAEDVEICDYH